MSETRKPFQLRAFTALMIGFSGLGLPITGLAMHSLDSAPMTAARHAWMSAHNVLGILFVVFAVWHVRLNRRALGSYLRGAASRITAISREAVLAAAIVAVVLAFVIAHAARG